MSNIDPQLLDLINTLGEVESEAKRCKAEADAIRADISIIIGRDGNTIIPGYGSLVIAAPSVTKAFAPDELRTLVAELRARGDELVRASDMADTIEGCQKPSYRDGGLRITPERGKKG